MAAFWIVAFKSSSLLLKCSLYAAFPNKHSFSGCSTYILLQVLKGLMLPALSLIFEYLLNLAVFQVFCIHIFSKTPVVLHPSSKTKSVISPELLILVCECAFSFWFLLLYPRIIFVLPSRCLFSSLSSDSACPCILNDWNLILRVLVWKASCNDRPLSQYFVTFLSFSLLMLS